MESDLSAEIPLTREVVLDAQLPRSVQTQRVEVRRIRIRAGHAAGPHVHNGPVVGSIVEGSVLFQVDGQERTVLRPGDIFFEPADVEVAHFDALDEDVTFLGYFLLAENQEPEIVMSEK